MNGRNSTSYIFYGLVLRRVLVFVITKTKRGLCFQNNKTTTPKFTIKFDLKLGGKNRTEDNLTDSTYFGYNLTSYFDRFDFPGS